jgi:hypothetical protein
MAAAIFAGIGAATGLAQGIFGASQQLVKTRKQRPLRRTSQATRKDR